MKTSARIPAISVLWVVAAAITASAALAGSAEPPVAVTVGVSPESVPAGSDALVTITLQPKAGIKLNRYPKIKLQVPAAPGLVDAAEGAIGNSAPPPPDHLEANYFKGAVDPLVVTLHLDRAAVTGSHLLPAKLSYFYCVAASGYCAPAKVDVSLPVTVR